MKKLHYLSTFIILFLCISSAFSQPVRRVFRADSRPPEDVFQNGFQAWGTNINFNAHILGISGRRGSRDSAFIPTTTNGQAAENFALDLLNVSPDATAYVYYIRATDNFYSAMTTMYNLYDSAGLRVPDTTRATIAAEQEYSAYLHISPEQIVYVMAYSREDGVIVRTLHANPNFDDLDSQANEEPFTYGMPYEINVQPMLLMGQSMTNINNEMPNNSTELPSPSYATNSIFCCMGYGTIQ